MPQPWKCTSPPTAEPLSLADAKTHLRVDFADDDSIISDNITEARERVEQHCSIGLLPQQWTFCLDRFPYGGYQDGAPSRSDYDMLGNLTWQGQIYHNRTSTILLPVGPIITVDSITYFDLNGTLQTLDPSKYLVDTFSKQPRITPAPNAYWPSTQYRDNAVTILFTVGYVGNFSDTLTVPATSPYTANLSKGEKFYKLTSSTGNTHPISVDSNGTVSFAAADAGATVVVNYQANTVPALILRAMKLLVSDGYDNRNDVVVGEGNVEKLPRGAESCLKNFRLYPFGYSGGR